MTPSFRPPKSPITARLSGFFLWLRARVSQADTVAHNAAALKGEGVMVVGLHFPPALITGEGAARLKIITIAEYQTIVTQAATECILPQGRLGRRITEAPLCLNLDGLHTCFFEPLSPDTTRRMGRICRAALQDESGGNEALYGAEAFWRATVA